MNKRYKFDSQAVIDGNVVYDCVCGTYCCASQVRSFKSAVLSLGSSEVHLLPLQFFSLSFCAYLSVTYRDILLVYKGFFPALPLGPLCSIHFSVRAL